MEHFGSRRTALLLTVVSQQIASFEIYKILSAVSKRKSDRESLPVMVLGDGNRGRSGNRVALLIHSTEDTTKFKTELWRQVNRPFSRYILHPTITCSTDYGSKQNEQSDVCKSFRRIRFL